MDQSPFDMDQPPFDQPGSSESPADGPISPRYAMNPPVDQAPDSPDRRGPTWPAVVAWIFIIGFVVAQFVLAARAQSEVQSDPDDTMTKIIFGIQGRYIVGAARGPFGQPELMHAQSAPQLHAGSVAQRLRAIVITAELAGSADARERVQDLRELVEQAEAKRLAQRAESDASDPDIDEALELDPVITEEQRAALDILAKLYADPNEGAFDSPESDAAELVQLGALTPDERDQLVAQLDWFGRLALTPPEQSDEAAREAVLAPAFRVFGIIIGGFIFGIIAAGGGFIGLVTIIVFAFLRRLQIGIHQGHSRHGIYAETFAIWFLLFGVMQFAAKPLATRFPDIALLIVGCAMLMSLSALVWPIIRGVPGGQMRTDIGWTFGRSPALEPLIGLGGYCMALPLLAIGVGLTLFLNFVQNSLAPPADPLMPATGPAHPIISALADGEFIAVLQILFVGSIVAPIVEETVFRGVLYRHLRDASMSLGFVMSVLLSTILNTFIFAIIHPQGWVAVPALMSLAIAFTLMREWRGTLIPSMIMHGVSNGIVLGFLFTVISAGKIDSLTP